VVGDGERVAVLVSLEGIFTSSSKGGSVTYVSCTICHPCLRPITAPSDRSHLHKFVQSRGNKGLVRARIQLPAPIEAAFVEGDS